MIFLFCGPPGTGKTLSMVHALVTDDQFKDRPLYVHGIPDLMIDHVPLDDATKWRDVPDGSVVVIDEAWRPFPTRNAGKDVPVHVQAFADHRHAGIDVLLATQDPADLDVFVRRRVNRYYQLQRPGNMAYAKRRVYEGVPTDTNRLMALQTEKWKYPTEIYDLYRSTVLDTHKRRLPKKLFFMVALLLVMLVGVPSAAWFAWGSLTGDSGEASELGSDSLSVARPVPVDEAIERRPDRNRVNWGMASAAIDVSNIEAYEPTRQGEHWTADAYRGKLVPASPPILNCVLMASTPARCLCHTEQATRALVPFERCVDIAVNGLYQPWRTDRNGRAGEPEAPPTVSGGSLSP